jgi:hypothetical protein
MEEKLKQLQNELKKKEEDHFRSLRQHSENLNSMKSEVTDNIICLQLGSLTHSLGGVRLALAYSFTLQNEPLRAFS